MHSIHALKYQQFLILSFNSILDLLDFLGDLLNETYLAFNSILDLQEVFTDTIIFSFHPTFNSILDLQSFELDLKPGLLYEVEELSILS